MREKKPSTRIWKLEEEAREKGGSSEKLTKIIKKNTQHAMGSRKSSRIRHRLNTQEEKGK